MSVQPSIRVVLGACREAAWAPSAVFALHVVCAQVLGLYARWPALDVPMHFVGGAAIAYFLARVIEHAQRRGFVGELHPGARFVAVFSLTAVAAVHWEFAEFLSDRFASTRAQGGLRDTLGDMFVGLVGGVTWLVLAGLAARGRVTVSEATEKKRGGAA